LELGLQKEVCSTLTTIDIRATNQPLADLDEKFPVLFDTIWNRFTSADGYEVFSDVFNTLKELKSRNITLGVVSNSDERVGEVYHMRKTFIVME
jgi:FMN phosphatase YigB (HAD superfamily)